MKDLASLLTDSGFSDITIDHEEIKIFYPGIKEVFHDLQLLGESSAIIARYPG